MSDFRTEAEAGKCPICGKPLAPSALAGVEPHCSDFRCAIERMRRDEFAEWLSDKAKDGTLERLIRGKGTDHV